MKYQALESLFPPGPLPTIVLSILLLVIGAGCSTTPNTGLPFVDRAGGGTYATLRATRGEGPEDWVFTVDNRTVARYVLGESVSHSGDV